MTTLNIILIAILQGITEFLPVSSSGHLILFSKFTSFPDQGIAMDIAVHVGSILAVMIYFSEEIYKMFIGLIKNYCLPNFKNMGNKLFYLICIATIPAVFAGIAFHEYGTEFVRNTKLIGWTILSFGIILYLADKFGMTIKKTDHLRVSDAIMIGIAQCFALIPGTSRSGITMTMGRILGLERREAAKFSMLLSIPTIFGAGVLVAYELWQAHNLSSVIYALDSITYSFLSSIIAIYIMMWWLKKSTFLPFVIYRICLGSFLLLTSYGYINLL
ncbi:MAG: undecaprenyl-diphosphate phosphatase [Alphaproteobacteria bacterium]|nr:undecaprenyl-diphosphate phosphatase [Alphaproteobacteria bacterium]